VKWDVWKKAFENYLLATGLNTVASDRRRAILLNSLGTEGQRMFYALEDNRTTSTQRTVQTVNGESEEKGQQSAKSPSSGDTGTTDPYDLAMKILNEHFRNNESVLASNIRFKQRKQFPGETIDEYMIALRELASDCQFQNKIQEDDAIRDQLVVHSTITRLQE
jgi:hypothetical protein